MPTSPLEFGIFLGLSGLLVELGVISLSRSSLVASNALAHLV